MRLFEIELPPLYVRSKSELRPGSILSEPHTCPLGSTCEGWIERHRPKSCLPRETSVQLYEHPPKDAEYVYLVQPIGQVDRFHTSWLKKLQHANPQSQGEMDQYASGFWSGDPIPEDRDAPWEYRVMEAKVLERVGGMALWIGHSA